MTFQIKGEEGLDIILIISQDEDIDHFIVHDENNQKVHFNKTIINENDDSNYYRLYFNYSEKPLKGKIIYEAYSSDNELLYRE
ncbi:hypothetical protein ACW2QC_01115 [Virgibacillus sp. FSP13]